MKADPLGEPRNPLAIYLLVLCFISGLGILVGVSTSGSIESALPEYLAQVWGFMLAFGSSVSLAGMFWQGDPRTGLLVKRVGMLSLSIAAFIYAVVIVVAAGAAGAFVAGIVAGFSVATFAQFLRINRRIHRIIQATP